MELHVHRNFGEFVARGTVFWKKKFVLLFRFLCSFHFTSKQSFLQFLCAFLLPNFALGIYVLFVSIPYSQGFECLGSLILCFPIVAP